MGNASVCWRIAAVISLVLLFLTLPAYLVTDVHWSAFFASPARRPFHVRRPTHRGHGISVVKATQGPSEEILQADEGQSHANWWTGNGNAMLREEDVLQAVNPKEEEDSKGSIIFSLASMGALAGILWSRQQEQKESGDNAPEGTPITALPDMREEDLTTMGLLQTISDKLSRVDLVLLAYFVFWYLGNYYYNIFNKVALVESGGSSGFPLTVACGQLFVAALYPIVMWLLPDVRKAPKITWDDIKAIVPVSLCAAGAHCSSVFALGAGAVSFAQIVKAAEPAFAAVLSTIFYGRMISTAKWLCLVPVIGGVAIASAQELDFSWAALSAAVVANMFAAVKGNENKKLMETAGIKDRLGSVGNQFGVTSILSFFISVPLVIVQEGSHFPEFLDMFLSNQALQFNIVASGLVFYGYNELAIMTIEKTSAVTQSVANTAKRVIVIIGVALVLGEHMDPMKLLGCVIGIGGVFLYSIIDSLVQPAVEKPRRARSII